MIHLGDKRTYLTITEYLLLLISINVILQLKYLTREISCCCFCCCCCCFYFQKPLLKILGFGFKANLRHRPKSPLTAHELQSIFISFLLNKNGYDNW